MSRTEKSESPMVEFTPENKRGRRILLTPGPLTTSRSVREAMIDDIGSWDDDCIELVADIRNEIVALAGGRSDLTSTLLQGSGSYGVEAMIGCSAPPGAKLLVPTNGAYGVRSVLAAKYYGIECSEIVFPEDQPVDPEAIDTALKTDPSITHVLAVHCETTTGLLNPIREIGLVVQKHNRRYLVDAVSSFGAYSVGPGEAIDFDAGPIDHMASSSNKCIEGVPGFSFVVSRVEAMKEGRGRARSLCLDLFDQWETFEKGGKFRFTPATHTLMAFRQALAELEAEGGPSARLARYRSNHELTVEGMARLGFDSFIAPEHQSDIISTFLHPFKGFDFMQFYSALRERGYIIYPGKLTATETFRIGHIGSIGPADVRGLLAAVEDVMKCEFGRSP